MTDRSGPSHEALHPGDRLGAYEITRPLGRGGMGTVFLAQDTILHRPVALKVLLAVGGEKSARQVLLREARSASALNHPNICTVYEVGDAHGVAYIAMEFVDGRPLSDVIAEAPLPLNDVVRYGIEAADALAYAHDHGVVHRDFKAANAIVSTAGRLKIVDFGLARRVDAALAEASTMATAVAAGAAGGTPYAMAPEQIRGEATDRRTDIWALGVFLYEAVSGSRPFKSSTTPDLLSSILRDRAASLPSGAASELKPVIDRCLQKRPGDRYEQAREVGAALEAIRARTTLGALSRRRSTMMAAAMVAVTLVATAAVWLLPTRDRDAVTSASTDRRLSDGSRASLNSEANAYYERALLFGGIGTANPDQALRMIESALLLDARFAAARAEFAFFQVERILNGRSNDASLYYKAETEARQALRDDPRCGRAHSVLALTYLLQGRKELVAAEVELALTENPDDPVAHGWRLHHHRFNGDYKLAREEADWLVRRWPLYWPAHLNLGELLREQGDPDGAIREQQRVLEQDPKNVYARVALARAYIDLRKLKEARTALEPARKDNSQHYTLRQTWALLLALEGKKADALREIDADLQTYSEIQIFGPSLAADFYAVMGDSDRALMWLDRAVRLGDDREEYLRRNALLAGVRAHPRFQSILDSVIYRRQQRAAR